MYKSRNEDDFKEAVQSKSPLGRKTVSAREWISAGIAIEEEMCVVDV